MKNKNIKHSWFTLYYILTKKQKVFYNQKQKLKNIMNKYRI